MTFDKYLSLGVIFFYSLGTFGLFLGALSKRPSWRAVSNILILLGFLLQTVAALSVLAESSLAELPSSYFMQLLAWAIVLAYLLSWYFLQARVLALTAAPLALILCFFSMREAGSAVGILPEELAGLFFTLHISALFASVGLLALAFGAGLLFLYLDGKLKQKVPAKNLSQDMPSLAAFDKVNKYAVIIGFPLYTIGLMAGFVWAPILAQAMSNPKVILSLFIWSLYAFLFYQRMALGYRGRKTAVLAIAIFAVSVVSFGIDYTVSHHSSLMQP